jgi:hypothetical protein
MERAAASAFPRASHPADQEPTTHVEVGTGPSLSTSGETLTIEESVNVEGENGERRDVGSDREWSWPGG